MKKLFLPLALLLALLLFAAQAHTATYFASPTGSNTAACAAGGTYSFARAVACATGILDRVEVRPGRYTTNATITNPASNITIQGSDPNPANWPVLAPTGGAVRGIHFNNTTRRDISVRFIKWDMTNTSAHACVSSSSDAHVTNFIVEDFDCLGPPVGKAADTAAAFSPSANTSGWTFRRGKITRWHSADGSPGAHCFYWQGDNGLIDQVECTDVNGYGLQYYANQAGGVVSPDNNVIQKSRFGGFNLRGPVYTQQVSKNTQIIDNEFWSWHPGSRAIELRGTGTKALRNKLYNAGGTGVRVACNSGCEIDGNTIVIPGGRTIDGSTGTKIGANSTVNPGWIDPVRGNFRLKTDPVPIPDPIPDPKPDPVPVPKKPVEVHIKTNGNEVTITVDDKKQGEAK